MNIIDTIKELVSIPSQLGNTGQIEDYVVSIVGKVADAEFVPVGENGRAVVAKVVHDEKFPTIVLNCHLDTVNVCGGWSKKPFEPVIEEDKLYGLGSSDMKAGVAIAMEVFRMFAALGNVNVVFTGSTDEEGDSASAFALLESGIKGDLCLIPEPTNCRLMMGCRGRLVCDILVRGISAHGAVPEKGVNAILEASRFVSALDKVELLEHETLGKGSLCVLEMTGGTSTLSVPEKCRLKLDRHYVPGETEEDILGALESVAFGLDSSAGFDIHLDDKRTTPFLKPYLTPTTELVERFCRATGAGAVYGKSVGDYNVFAGTMPTVVYGPDGANWHSADEWVSISSVDQCLDGYRRFAESF